MENANAPTRLPAKLELPQPATVLPRERLFRRLDRYRERGIVWIGGPPGAGKTTLAISYLRTHRLPFIWYRVDETDTDVARLFHDLYQATLQTVPEICKPSPLRYRDRGEIPLVAFSKRFFRDLFAPVSDPLVLVFDDLYRVSEDNDFHQALAEGLIELPKNISVLIISRSKPPSPWVPLWLKEQLTLLDGSALQLTRTEIEALTELRTGVPPTPQFLHMVQDHIQGWAAGIILLLKSGDLHPRRALPAPPAFEQVFQYLAQEIWREMAPTEQRILVQAALLPTMSDVRLSELTGDPEAIRTIQELQQNDYFTVRLGNGEYQFHPLFRRFLLKQLENTCDPSQCAERRLRAARVLAPSEPEAAAELMQTAGDWQGLVRLIGEHSPTLLAQGRYRTLEGWLTALPREWFEQEPSLFYWLGSSRLPYAAVDARFQFTTGFDRLQRQPNPDPTLLYLSWVGIVNSLWLAGDSYRGVDHWIAVLKGLLERFPEFPSLEVEVRVTAALIKVLSNCQLGDPLLTRWVERGRKLLHQDLNSHLQKGLVVELAYHYFWLGHPAKARVVLDASGASGSAESAFAAYELVLSLVALAVDWLLGHYDSAWTKYEAGLTQSRNLQTQTPETIFLLYGTLLCLSTGDSDEATNLLDQAHVLIDSARPYRHCQYHYLRACCAMQKNQLGQGLEHAEMALQAAVAAGTPFFEALARLALAHFLFVLDERDQSARQIDRFHVLCQQTPSVLLSSAGLFFTAYRTLVEDRPERGLDDLRKALAQGRAHALIGFVWWQPGIMAKLCAEALWADIETPYVQTLIRRNRLVPEREDSDLENWPWPVQVITFGGFEVRIGGEPLQTSAKAPQKVIALLKVLIALGAESVHLDQVTDALWPDAEGDAAHRIFDTTLHRLRRLLDEPASLTMTASHLSLNWDRCWVDVHAFERLTGDIQRTLQQEGGEAALERQTQRLLNLYRGPFLANEPEEPWLIAPRERLRRRFINSITEIAAYHVRHDALEKAITCYRQALEREPLAEDLHYDLRRIYRERREPHFGASKR